jgi:hypothetical protein
VIRQRLAALGIRAREQRVCVERSAAEPKRARAS